MTQIRSNSCKSANIPVINLIYLRTFAFLCCQVRLYQYSDSSVIWRSGSVLRKNDHIAIISQSRYCVTHLLF